MIGFLAACAVLVADPADRPSADDRSAYEAARERAGRSSDAHVRLALWCESRGLSAERAAHLATAVALDPGHAAARGLLGLVPDGPRWRRPEAVADRLSADPAHAALLSEYATRRAKAPATADGQWSLALWCESKGLPDESRAHFAATVRIDPSREAAWKRLGCKKVGGRWLTDAEAAARKAEAEAQKAADRRWKVALLALRDRLQQPARREKAEADLALVTDPRAVPSVLQVFGASARTVQLLGQIEGPLDSQSLAALAVSAASDAVRRSAAETLSRRDPREFVSALVAAIVPKVRYQVRHVGGPSDPGAILIEGQEFNRRRIYAPSPTPETAVLPGDVWGRDDNGLPVIMRLLGSVQRRMSADELRRQAEADLGHKTTLAGGANSELNFFAGKIDESSHAADRAVIKRIDAALPGSNAEFDTPLFAAIPVGRMQLEAQRSAVAAEQQLAADIAALDSYNASVGRFDDRIRAILAPISGIDYGDDISAWQRWSTDLRGYASAATSRSDRPTIDEDVPINYQPDSIPIGLVQGSTTLVIAHSCFAAGTMVKTRIGDRPIEALAAGDVVLSRDVETGRLDFRPVVAVFHNPPAATYRVRFGDRDVVATGIHRFWKAGAGWVMARDLKAGDLVRTVEGVAGVTAVEPGPRQKVFNLQVDGIPSFFVGEVGAMVHDNSLVRPATAAFDRVPELTSEAKPLGAGR